ncbi:hypothetical protein K1X84_08820 [bacterium]|nr:hypothetical protein [bacterium]
MKFAILLILLASSAFPQMSDSSVDFQVLHRKINELPFGPYSLGLTMTDSMIIWFPSATNRSSEKITLGDYFRLIPRTELSEMRPWLSVLMTGKDDLDSLTASRILALPMMAARTSQPVNTKQPLIVWGARHDVYLYQPLLCEFLASHGYVVIFPTVSFPWPWKIPKDERVQSLQKLMHSWFRELQKAKALPYVDSSRIGVLAWSYAGESSEWIQTTDPNVNAVISLSSNTLDDGIYFGPTTRGNRKIDRLNVPYVLMSERIKTNGSIQKIPALMDSLPAQNFFVFYDSLSHGNFNFLEGYLPAIAGLESVQPWSRKGDDAINGYIDVLKLTLYFFDALVKQKHQKIDEPDHNHKIRIITFN